MRNKLWSCTTTCDSEECYTLLSFKLQTWHSYHHPFLKCRYFSIILTAIPPLPVYHEGIRCSQEIQASKWFLDFLQLCTPKWINERFKNAFRTGNFKELCEALFDCCSKHSTYLLYSSTHIR